MIASWKKKVASCDRRVKHFPFLQKQTLLGTVKGAKQTPPNTPLVLKEVSKKITTFSLWVT